MIGRKTQDQIRLEGRVDKLERELVMAKNEAIGARSNFLMAVNQIGKLKEYVDSHVHTMRDENGEGEPRPQGEVINILHEMLQVLESEANTIRVDQNGMRDALAAFGAELSNLESSLRELCDRLGSASMAMPKKEG